ncbi:MAG: phosphotransferase, partial [Candidatus Promineifilaceae bacterium]|nr:phosphotransferase [Candidatus Promineifilaceae bacterium]
LAHGWEAVANDPAPFLSLGIVSQNWLEAALPSLLAIDGKAVLRGESLLHLDVRSDNICFLNNRTLLVDWNRACTGNPVFDLGASLPTVEVQGGPPPETLLPDGREIAALVSGYWASQAGLPPFPGASEVRGLQRRVLAESALPWAVRALKLPPLDGKAGYL